MKTLERVINCSKVATHLTELGMEEAVMARRYALRDDQWDHIKDLLPGRDGHVGVTAKDNRLFVEAVLYRYRVGIP